VFVTLGVNFVTRTLYLDRDCRALTGAALLCVVAEHPEDYTHWNALHVYEYIRCLCDNADALMTETGQCAFFSTTTLQLTPDADEESVNAAWKYQREFLQLVGVSAENYHIIGTTTPHQLDMETRMRHVLHVMHAAYEVMLGRALLQRAVRGGGATDGDNMYLCPHYYAQAAADDQNVNAELFRYLLSVAARRRLRRRGGIVYAPKMVETFRWRVPQDAPLCKARACVRPACFGWRHTRVREWCEEHGPEVARQARESAAHGGGGGGGGGSSSSGGGGNRGAGAGAGAGAPAPVPPGFEAGAHVVVDLRRDDMGVLNKSERVKCTVDTQTWLPITVPWKKDPLSVKQWAAAEVDRLQNGELWSKLTRNFTASMTHIEKYFELKEDGAFRFLVPDSHYYSFRNGIFHTRTATFTPYGSTTVYGGNGDVAASRLPASSCCLNYVDEQFDPAWCVLPLDSADMQVRGFSRILADQGYDREMCAFFYGMLGRLFFKVKECDNWDKLMVIKGAGGSGKSTITHALLKLMGPSNIGVIPSLCEPQYALANLDGKALWMCVELRADFRLDSGQLQSMVAGDITAVHQKFCDQREVKWTVPGLLVGNQVPALWAQDAANAMSRRVVLFPFENFPRPDPTVAKAALENSGKLLAVAVREYHALVERSAGRDLDAVLPERMRESAAAFKTFSNPALQFIQECPDLDLAPEDQRRAMIVYLVRVENVRITALKLTGEGVAALESQLLPPRAWEDDAWKRSVKKVLQDYTMSMKDMKQKWVAAGEDKHKRPSPFNKRDDYDAACAELLLPVLNDPGIFKSLGVVARGDQWFGVRVRPQRIDDAMDEAFVDDGRWA
jgi:uncharacterized membrane protein YgcG